MIGSDHDMDGAGYSNLLIMYFLLCFINAGLQTIRNDQIL